MLMNRYPFEEFESIGEVVAMTVTLTLQKPDLIEKLEQIATEQSTSAQDLLHTAVNEFLDKMARQKIHTESESFRKMHPDLMTKYEGQFVAIHNGQVVDHDEDARDLYLRVQVQYGHIAVLIRRVTPEAQQELVFRSPRLTRARP